MRKLLLVCLLCTAPLCAKKIDKEKLRNHCIEKYNENYDLIMDKENIHMNNLHRHVIFGKIQAYSDMLDFIECEL